MMSSEPAPASHPVASALDLGSTRFKLGFIDAAGRLVDMQTVPAPELSGAGLIREAEPDAMLAAVDGLLAAAAPDRPTPLVLVCQRSTFVVWDRDSGRPLTPVVSWQDRRADDWCAAHTDIESLLREQTGLLLSPHYAGPKLAAMMAADPALADRLRAGDALFGNLDTWLSWRWSNGAVHQTDVTMAARTAMFDIVAGDWSDSLLAAYGVPRPALPRVTGNLQGGRMRVGNFDVCGSIADQAAGVIAVTRPDDDDCLINFGTGAFVLRPVADPGVRRPSYLTGPVLVSPRHGARFVIEGTINGSGPAVDGFGPGPTTLPTHDDWPEAFIIPDSSGVGAPHWRADIGLTLSPAAEQAGAVVRRLICIEGLVFRVFEILRGLGDGQMPARVLIAGGLAREPAVAEGLAALLGRPVLRLDEPEATLLGAARLAGGQAPYGDPASEAVVPGGAGGYLTEKFSRWQRWCARTFAAR